MKKLIFAAVSLTVCLQTGCAQESSAIGSIGGADGPTKIIVATGGGGWWILPSVLVLLTAVAVLFIKRKRK